MNGNFETTFGIGSSFSGYPMSRHPSHPPEAAFMTHHPIADLGSLHRCTGKCPCHSRHPNGIPCPIGGLYFVELHIECRPLVFFHPESGASPVRLQAVNTHLSRLRQFKRTLESTEFIGLHLLLRHLPTVGIHQLHDISASCLDLCHILALGINDSRIMQRLTGTVKRTVGKEIHILQCLIHRLIVIPS